MTPHDARSDSTPEAAGDSCGPPTDSTRLDGWKQIAAYLDLSMRTAQRWHTMRGLPVHRIGGEGAARASVYAYPSQIEGWRQRWEEAPDGRETGFRHRSLGFLIGSAAVVLAFLAIAWSRSRPEPVASLDYASNNRIGDDSYVSLRAAGGRVLETRTFANTVVQATIAETYDGSQLIIVGFGEGDPRMEGRVVAYDREWIERWNFNTFDATRMREVRELGYNQSDHLRPTDLLATLHRGRRVLLIIAQDQAWFASRIVLLDLATGSPTAEYWVAGKVGYGTAVLADIDGDGDDEVAIPGFQNELQGELVGHAEYSAIVFALDLGDLEAWGSAQLWPPRWPSLPIRQPKWYLLFPTMPGEPGTIHNLEVEDHGREGAEEIVVVTSERRHYTINLLGSVTQLGASQQWHDKWGVTAVPPQPIRLGYFGAAVSDCLRGESRAASAALGLALQAGETSSDDVAVWQRRCQELAGMVVSDLSGIVPERGWGAPPVVREVAVGSPADRAGVEAGDVIQQVGRDPVRDGLEFRYLMMLRGPDPDRTLTVLRGPNSRRLLVRSHGPDD